ncbi:esterase FE4-like [Schistocerca piceifrons]|uniref:esterase FE4-like n=1 Tax=Schistocerca piceifrons TaxID=274613 RepID=UPI001F5E7AC6|nr:esterase FE4-like [Schistocerca piceifrons]
MAFVPVVEAPSDSAVIVEPPADILRNGSYNQVPIIVGATSAEGTVVPTLTEAKIADMKENTMLIGSQLPLPTEEQRTRAAEQLEQFYFRDEGFSLDDMQAVIDGDVIVTVENGDLRGVVATSLNGALYNQFLGIPFATPPVGDLRFRDPQPAPSWSGVRDALTLARGCPQTDYYLNVYVPATGSGPFPVMVYIHGGGFSKGFSFNGTPHYFVEKGAVLITTAYRLGALGFMSLQNDDIPGNAGLKDQVLALQWVQNNIAAFGGDPSKVAIFGESAGGASTSHLFLSPATRGLFSQVIMQSGVATTPWALANNPREKAYRMAEALGFQAQGGNHTDDDDVRLAAFFRAANCSDLINDTSIALSDLNRCPLSLAFVPAVEPPSDSAVIVESPADILSTGSYNQVPIIVGVTSAEGTVVPTLTEAKIADLKENFTMLIGSQLPLPTEEQRTRAAEQLQQFYFGDEGFSTDDMQAVIDLFSDLYFIQSADSFARTVANSNSLPVHFYFFEYNGTGSTDYGMCLS